MKFIYLISFCATDTYDLFPQSIAAAIGFYYSDVLILQWQLLINVVMGTLGLLGFCVVEWESSRAARAGYQSI